MPMNLTGAAENSSEKYSPIDVIFYALCTITPYGAYLSAAVGN